MRRVIIDSSGGGKPGTAWFPLVTEECAIPNTNASERLLLKMDGAALNHRDVFQRQNSYPNLSKESAVGADGVGHIVGVASGLNLEHWIGKRVLLTPGRGWESDPAGPEHKYGILGGQKGMIGTFAEYAVVPDDEVVECPAHLTTAEAAALPLAGLTAFRATFTKAKVGPGTNLLITGIGGGVALFCLQFAVAIGANVWVTSGTQEKIDRAVKLGAKGGISYKVDKWGKQLYQELKMKFDVVIDSAGGNIVSDVLPLLKNGGVIVAYGMTVAPKIVFTMQAVLANIEYLGSTMGSKNEFGNMVRFVAEHKIRPVVHKSYNGLQRAEEAFDEMKNGTQFGKLVILLTEESLSKL